MKKLNKEENQLMKFFNIVDKTLLNGKKSQKQISLLLRS